MKIVRSLVEEIGGELRFGRNGRNRGTKFMATFLLTAILHDRKFGALTTVRDRRRVLIARLSDLAQGWNETFGNTSPLLKLRILRSFNGRWKLRQLLKELRHNPMLWLLALVPVALVAAQLVPYAHTLLFISSFSVLAIVPLAALLGHATCFSCGKDWRRCWWTAQCYAWKLDGARHCGGSTPRRGVCFGKRLHRRCHCDQHAFHARVILSSRRPQAPSPRVQPGDGPPACGFALFSYDCTREFFGNCRSRLFAGAPR